MKFRDLRADEIDCRVAMVKENGVSLLLYKDARCDMNILDETVGAMNWQREHCRDNANCIVSIWDDTERRWVSKEDTGTESNTEKEKGLASDSFKRACFNWGIGRELYTAPFIWIPVGKVKIENKNGRLSTFDRFKVKDITITEKKITGLTIVNEKTNVVVFSMNEQANPQEEKKQEENPQDDVGKKAIDKNMIKSLRTFFDKNGIDEEKVVGAYKLNKIEELNISQYAYIVKHPTAMKESCSI